MSDPVPPPDVPEHAPSDISPSGGRRSVFHPYPLYNPFYAPGSNPAPPMQTGGQSETLSKLEGMMGTLLEKFDKFSDFQTRSEERMARLEGTVRSLHDALMEEHVASSQATASALEQLKDLAAQISTYTKVSNSQQDNFHSFLKTKMRDYNYCVHSQLKRLLFAHGETRAILEPLNFLLTPTSSAGSSPARLSDSDSNASRHLPTPRSVSPFTQDEHQEEPEVGLDAFNGEHGYDNEDFFMQGGEGNSAFRESSLLKQDEREFSLAEHIHNLGLPDRNDAHHLHRPRTPASPTPFSTGRVELEPLEPEDEDAEGEWIVNETPKDSHIVPSSQGSDEEATPFESCTTSLAPSASQFEVEQMQVLSVPPALTLLNPERSLKADDSEPTVASTSGTKDGAVTGNFDGNHIVEESQPSMQTTTPLIGKRSLPSGFDKDMSPLSDIFSGSDTGSSVKRVKLEVKVKEEKPHKKAKTSKSSPSKSGGFAQFPGPADFPDGKPFKTFRIWPQKIKPANENAYQEYIQCDNCHYWYHFICVGITRSEKDRTTALRNSCNDPEIEWSCPPCLHYAKNKRATPYNHGGIDACARTTCHVVGCGDFAVEKLFGRRYVFGSDSGQLETQYLFKWVGYPYDQSNWQDASTANDTLIERFNAEVVTAGLGESNLNPLLLPEAFENGVHNL